MDTALHSLFVDCNMCGRDDTHLIGEKDGYDIVRCRHCSLVYVNPQPSEQKIRELYSSDSVPGDYQAGFLTKIKSDDEAARRYSSVIRVNEIERHLGELPRSDGLRLLDIGCGEGYVVEAARRKGWEAYGVEPPMKNELFMAR